MSSAFHCQDYNHDIRKRRNPNNNQQQQCLIRQSQSMHFTTTRRRSFGTTTRTTPPPSSSLSKPNVVLKEQNNGDHGNSCNDDRPIITRLEEYPIHQYDTTSSVSSATSLSKISTATNNNNERRSTILYTLQQDSTWQRYDENAEVDDSRQDTQSQSPSSSTDHDIPKNHHEHPKQWFYHYVVKHFLPADYPHSVAPGYHRFAFLGFCASIAGSAAMVLSTQTLLLAVGIVSHTNNSTSSTTMSDDDDDDSSIPLHQAGIMVGALHWVLKDGIGQLGGVWFASYMGQRASAFDANPKHWRMMAAMALDMAVLMELMAPLAMNDFTTTDNGSSGSNYAVLAIASIANIARNIGFLTASASRAALHQSLQRKNNLGDITAKAGSQSMAASLVGTTLGIGLSPLLADVPHFTLGFVGLSMIHLGCNYYALKAVPLSHFNRHRLELVLQAYTTTGKVLSPEQVAERENFLVCPTVDWLQLGSSIQQLGGPEVVQKMIDPKKAYILTNSHRSFSNHNSASIKDNPVTHLVFFHHATATDILEGMCDAFHHHHHDNQHNGDDDTVMTGLDEFLTELTDKGWNLENEQLRIEPANAIRIHAM